MNLVKPVFKFHTRLQRSPCLPRLLPFCSPCFFFCLDFLRCPIIPDTISHWGKRKAFQDYVFFGSFMICCSLRLSWPYRPGPVDLPLGPAPAYQHGSHARNKTKRKQKTPKHTHSRGKTIRLKISRTWNTIPPREMSLIVAVFGCSSWASLCCCFCCILLKQTGKNAALSCPSNVHCTVNLVVCFWGFNVG